MEETFVQLINRKVNTYKKVLDCLRKHLSSTTIHLFLPKCMGCTNQELCQKLLVDLDSDFAVAITKINKPPPLTIEKLMKEKEGK